MNLTTTEKYALAVLKEDGRLSALQKEKRGICLVASCIWDLIEAGAAVPDEKGKLKISAPLPQNLEYCRCVYKMAAKKPRKPEDIILEYVFAFTEKRMNTLVESIADGLIGKGALITEEQHGLWKAKLCHVDDKVLADNMAAIQSLDGEVNPDQLMLAILLLNSGSAEKLLSKEELSNLKGAVRRDNGNFQPYVKNMIRTVETAICSLTLSGTAAVVVTQ